MSNAEQRWSAEHSRQFQEHYKTVRGYVRRQITRENLAAHLEGFLKYSRRVIDVDGSQGDDARWLKGQPGYHHVGLIESDPLALEEAHGHSRPALDFILEGTAETAIARFSPESFELVMSHGKLLYAEDPAAELSQLAALLQRGGYLSLLTSGRIGKKDRFERRGDIASSILLDQTGEYTNNLGKRARAYYPHEIAGLLENAGLVVDGWYGVRVFADKDQWTMYRLSIETGC
jgi:SAM-dependent methyltransferase